MAIPLQHLHSAPSHIVNMEDNIESRQSLSGRFFNRVVSVVNTVKNLAATYPVAIYAIGVPVGGIIGVIVSIAVKETYVIKSDAVNSGILGVSIVTGVATAAFLSMLVVKCSTRNNESQQREAVNYSDGINNLVEITDATNEEIAESEEYSMSAASIRDAIKIYEQLPECEENIDDDARSSIGLENKEDIKYCVIIDKQLYDFLNFYKAIKETGKVPHTDEVITMNDLLSNKNNKIKKINVQK